MSDNDNASPPAESVIAPPTGEIPANGAKHHVDPRLSPKQQQRQAKVENAIDKRVRGQGGGTYNELVNEVLDAEVNPSIERLGIHARDVRVDVYREEPPGPRGQPLNLGGFSLDVAPTGHQLQEMIEESFHCVRQDTGQGTYRLTFRTYHQGKWLGDGRLHLDSCADIMARRELARRRQAAQGGGSPPSIGYVPPPISPPPPAQQQQQPYTQGFPPSAYPQQPQVFQVHAPAPAQQPDAVSQLRESLGVVIELANRLGFTQPQAAPPTPAAAPMTEQRMAEVVAAAVVAGLKASGIGGAAPANPTPAPNPAEQLRGLGDFANAVLDGFVTLKRTVGRIDKEIGNMVGVSGAPAEVVGEPNEVDDDLPFRVIPVPGVKVKGAQVNFAEDKESGKVHLWGLAVSNAEVVGEAVNKGAEILEKIVDANTITAKVE